VSSDQSAQSSAESRAHGRSGQARRRPGPRAFGRGRFAQAVNPDQTRLGVTELPDPE